MHKLIRLIVKGCIRIIPVFIVILLFSNCRSKKIYSEEAGVEAQGVSVYYNADSTYYAVVSEIVNEATGRPPKFYIVNQAVTDTIYTSTSQYKFKGWYSENEVELLQVPGLVENKDLETYQQSEKSVYYNIEKQKIITSPKPDQK